MSAARKRRVIYFSGFDPRGVGAYHRLFRDEAGKRVSANPQTIVCGPRKREGPLVSGWTAESADTDGNAVRTSFEFVHWDDIARRHWHDGWLRLYGIAIRTYWHSVFGSDLLLRRIRRLSKWNFLAGLAPALVLFLLPPLALLAGWGGYSAGQAVFPGSAIAPALIAGGGFGAVIALAWWLERFFTLGWLLRTFNFVLQSSRGRVPEFDDRMDQFARHLAGRIAASDDDEILIVGHSVGANVAVSTLARLLAGDPQAASRKPLGLLTLGGSIPMQGQMPWASRFREELALVASRHELAWVDVSASEDVASFAMLNPVSASGLVPGPETANRPLVISGCFRERLTAETYAQASWDMFRMHFQYLMAGEHDLPNDYFAITTGFASFRERFGVWQSVEK